MSRKVRVPSLRLHWASRQYCVELGGRTFYLGRDPEAAQVDYQRLIGEWIANGRQTPSLRGDTPGDLSVNELVVAFLKWADGYYRRPDGSATKEPENLRLSLRLLCWLYGETPAVRFGPLALRTVREGMVAAGLCRAECNRRVSRIRYLFKWGAGRELIPITTHQSLLAVEPLKLGRSEARESPPVGAVPEAFLEEILPFLGRQVAAMVRLQQLTGMRPGEVVAMRSRDLDTSGVVWLYVPPAHKMSYRDRPRRIPSGRGARRSSASGSARSWRPTCSSLARRMRSGERPSGRPARAGCNPPRSIVARPDRRGSRATGMRLRATTGGRSTTRSSGRINRERAARGEPFMAVWSPHAIRHLRATQPQREFGWDVARATLGHAGVDCTAIYAERDERLASDAALRVGRIEAWAGLINRPRGGSGGLATPPSGLLPHSSRESQTWRSSYALISPKAYTPSGPERSVPIASIP